MSFASGLGFWDRGAVKFAPSAKGSRLGRFTRALGQGDRGKRSLDSEEKPACKFSDRDGVSILTGNFSGFRQNTREKTRFELLVLNKKALPSAEIEAARGNQAFELTEADDGPGVAPELVHQGS